jgi:hypothetical protein
MANLLIDKSMANDVDVVAARPTNSLENNKFLDIYSKKLIKIPPFDCEHASNVDQLFAEHATINQMVATPTGVQSGLRFTAFAHFVA